MSINPVNTIASNPAAASSEPVSFTHRGEEYSVTTAADGSKDVTRGDITIHFNPQQAADLKGLPNDNVLFGAPMDAPNASFQGTPLGQLFDEPLW